MTNATSFGLITGSDGSTTTAIAIVGVATMLIETAKGLSDGKGELLSEQQSAERDIDIFKILVTGLLPTSSTSGNVVQDPVAVVAAECNDISPRFEDAHSAREVQGVIDPLEPDLIDQRHIKVSNAS
ncbi:hypothetical protein QBC37DRAFT_379235 [Rhypophila decipiens]|uniref:Uncharacterized protein n=1 Tax=Rhypophila decipiens TaxID=261697 RepID=A0AAN6XX36_9PEZI|nr:hypothetical protein QBC37DRAFT_379235 [Rhypophila decipiens]